MDLRKNGIQVCQSPVTLGRFLLSIPHQGQSHQTRFFLKPSLVCLGSVGEKRVETLKTLAFWRGAWRETHLFNRESRLGQMQTTSLVLVQPRLTLARQEPSIDVRAWRAWRRKAIYALSYPLFSCAYNRLSFPFSFNQWLMLNHKKHTWWWRLKDQGKIRDRACVVSPAK